MANDRNGKREVVVAIIVGLLVLAIAIGMVIMKNKNKAKDTKDETKNPEEVVISYDGYELSEEEIEQEAERLFEDDYTATEVFLGMVGSSKSGKNLLYNNEDEKIDFSLLLYMSEEDREANFKESEETISVDSKDYKLYETGISYDEYKAELLKYMSESVFDKYFKPYTKNIDGKLYITNEDEEEITLESFENIEEGKYVFTYQKDGESKDGEITINKTERTITEVKM